MGKTRARREAQVGDGSQPRSGGREHRKKLGEKQTDSCHDESRLSKGTKKKRVGSGSDCQEKPRDGVRDPEGSQCPPPDREEEDPIKNFIEMEEWQWYCFS